jgi:hypothetical protein
MSFQPCSSCACHIKVSDARCPFCGAVNTRRPPRRGPAGRMSRAQWLAFGSVALVGCVGTVAESSGDGGGAVAQHDAGNTPAHDAGNQVQPPPDSGIAYETGTVQEAGPPVDSGIVVADDSGVSCPTRSGYFNCQGNVCDRSIQACQNGYCEWYGALATSWQFPDAASCGPCPTCECLQGSLSTSCHCSEDNQGTITISCGGCYGSPPARLERLVG